MKCLTMALLAVVMLAGAPAFAQAPSSADAPMDTSAVDDALDLYWGQQQSDTAVERRNHPRALRHEMSVYTGIIPNERFHVFYPLGARYNLFFSDDIGMELWGAYTFKVASEIYTFYLEDEGMDATLLGAQSELPPELLFMTGASFVWSPIHGKFAAFGSKLTHFDFFIAAGFTLLGTTQIESNASADSLTSNSTTTLTANPGGHIGLGLRLQFLDWFAARIEYRQHFYEAILDATPAPAEFNIGFSFWTPGGEQ
ncbi:MAG: outer membrane beta-barrel domain-containing protein [Myxococcota bacterium]